MSETSAQEEPQDLAAARALLTAKAVRERSAMLFDHIEAGRSEHFSFDPAALQPIAERVAALTAERFPDGDVPFHSRWRHFEVGGIDRFASLAAARNWSDDAQAARAMGDLAVVSVLLDAGAGPAWRYREAASGQEVGRSEGLALASLAMFTSGVFSGVPADPLRADAEALQELGAEEFAAGFQIRDDNPLDGADGRRDLLVELSNTIRFAPEIFALEDDPRPGGIIDALAAEAQDGAIPAPRILELVLEGFGPIWPSRLELGGLPLGDTWRHEAVDAEGPGGDLVPFHKLSGWLSLSLIEPLKVRGLTVTDLSALPALAEYRNGGLLVDGGALSLRAEVPAGPYAVDHPLVVEWRASTVTLIDRLLPLVRERLGAPDLSMAAMLEGGTWLAGRQLAAHKRADASAPIAIVSDGTVF